MCLCFCILPIEVHMHMMYTVIVRQERKPFMEGSEDMEEMTQAELILLLETLAENIEIKAKTAAEAAEIIRKKIEALK
mgnify:CR=1 FL=1